MLGALAILLWATAAAALPAIPACPSADALTFELDRLGATASLAVLGSPEVMVEGARMRVVLRGRDGSILGSREVAAPETCAERASVAAVFVAAWVGAWSTNPIPSLPLRDPATTAPATGEPKARDRDVRAFSRVAAPMKSPPVLPTETSTPPTAPTPPLAPPPPTTPAQPPAQTVLQSAKTATSSRRFPAVEIAGLAFGTHDGDAGTFGAGLLVSYAIADALAMAALLETTGTRDAAVGPVRATYRTSRLGAGASVRHRWGRLLGDAGIFPELTMLAANGQPMAAARSVTSWGAAVEARGRLGLAFGRFLPFLFAGASGALRADRLTLDDYPTDATTLSRWNFSAGAGLAILRGTKD